MLGLMFRILMFSIVLFLGAIVFLHSRQQTTPEPEVATIFLESLPLPQFALVDQTGLGFDSSQRLLGHFTLMFFGFTHCPDICPITLQTLATAASHLEEQGVNTPEILFISVDSNRDTPERMGPYLANFDSNFVGLTGPPEALDPLLGALGLTIQIHQHPGQNGYTVIHNSTVFVIAPRGELIATFSGPHDATTIAKDYLRIRNRYRKNPPQPATS